VYLALFHGVRFLDYSDPEMASVVAARAPWDREERITLYVLPSLVRGYVDDRSNAKVGQYAALVHGEGYRSGLVGAHALFSGLHRPLNESRDEDEIYTYVMSPNETFTYPDKTHGSVVSAARPKDSVFVAWAAIARERPFTRKHVLEPIPASVHGIVTGWEWAKADAADPSLPDAFNDRYKRREW
jgi:hypothetical protein